MNQLLNPAKQKLNWTRGGAICSIRGKPRSVPTRGRKDSRTGWFQHVFKLKQNDRSTPVETSAAKTPEMTDIEVRIDRTLHGYCSRNSDYIEENEEDLGDYIGSLDVKIYSVYMNYEINLMTYRQLDLWLTLYCAKYYRIIMQNFDNFFVPHHIKQNVFEPSSIMLRLIDLATEREKLFKHAFETNLTYDNATRKFMYEDINKKEEEILKRYRTIKYNTPKRAKKRKVERPTNQPVDEDIEI